MSERDPTSDERALLGLLPDDGTKTGNGSLRKAPGWDEQRYDGAKAALLAAGLVVAGPGRGGSLGRSGVARGARATEQRDESGDAEPASPPVEVGVTLDGFDPDEPPSTFRARPHAADGGVTVVHAADIHLDSPLHGLERYPGAPTDALRGATRRALENLVALCEQERAQVLLVAGDLYDGDWHDYGTGLFFARQMSRLRDLGVRVFVVRGNHDAESRITRTLWLPDNVTTFGSAAAETHVLDDLGIAVHGRSYARRDTNEDLSASYPAPVPGLLNVGVLHTSATGRPPHRPYAPCAPGDLAAKGYQYWALGHVHEREILSERPWIVFPGNLQGRHARETGAKGCMVVTADGTEVRSVEHRSLDVVRWLDLAVDVTGCATEGDAFERFREALQRDALGTAHDVCAVRVRLQGATRAHAALQRRKDGWQADARSFASGVGGGRVWLEKILVETRPEADVARIAARGGAIGELLAEIDLVRGSRERLDGLAAILDDLRGKLPAAVRDGDDALVLDADFVRAALADVESVILPRLVAEEA